MIGITRIALITSLAAACFFPGSGQAAEENRSPNIFGLGASIRSKPYNGADTEIWPVPIIIWREGRLFVNNTIAGYTAWEKNSIAVNAILQPRFMGYDSGDSIALNGMNDRDSSLEAGLQAVWKIPRLAGVELSGSLTTDLLSKHEGHAADLTLSKRFNFLPLFIDPGISLRWQSDNLTDYYYGVSATEAAAMRPAYNPDSSISIVPSLGVYLALSEEWIVISRTRLHIYDDEVTDSPIVDEDVTISVILGIARMF